MWTNQIKKLVSSMDVEKYLINSNMCNPSLKRKKIIKILYYILFQIDGINIVKGIANSLDNIMSTLEI